MTEPSLNRRLKSGAHVDEEAEAVLRLHVELGRVERDPGAVVGGLEYDRDPGQAGRWVGPPLQLGQVFVAEHIRDCTGEQGVPAATVVK
jgi:hypothetical protein